MVPHPQLSPDEERRPDIPVAVFGVETVLAALLVLPLLVVVP